MKIFRVTEVLKPYNNFGMISAETLQAAADRGTAVHAHLTAYVQGLYSVRPESSEGYCESGERWIDAHVKRVISAEQEYVDSVLGFLGHPDLLIEDQRGAILLVDWKTPVTESKSWAIQIAAYHHLVTKHYKFKKKNVAPAALMLSPTGGNARFLGYYENLDYYFGLFLAALNLIKYFEEGKNASK